MRRFYRNIINGLFYGYPVCCVVWYALGKACGAESQAVRRGCIHIDSDSRYVVCCHWKHPGWLPFGSRRYSRL